MTAEVRDPVIRSLTTGTPQLAFKRPHLPTNGDHRALKRATLGALGLWDPRPEDPQHQRRAELRGGSKRKKTVKAAPQRNRYGGRYRYRYRCRCRFGLGGSGDLVSLLCNGPYRAYYGFLWWLLAGY